MEPKTFNGIYCSRYKFLASNETFKLTLFLIEYYGELLRINIKNSF